MASFIFAFMFLGNQVNAQPCPYSSDQITLTVNNTSAYVYPFTTASGGFVSGRFQVLWREVGTPGWNNSLEVSSHFFTIQPLEECTKYEYCVRKKCGPNNWSDFTEILTFMTPCECPCDEDIVISSEADPFETAAYLYAQGYTELNHQFFYRPKNSGQQWQHTPWTFSHYDYIDDLIPCTDYEYYLVVQCPEYDCPDACEYDGETKASEIHCFKTLGCHPDTPTDTIAPVDCCDYIFLVDKSGSMSDEDIAEAECRIQRFIDQVIEACPEECGATFSITTFQGTNNQDILNDFECNPTVDLGHSGGGDNISDATNQVSDWLDDRTLDPGEDSRCLHVVIYTDALCSSYGDFGDAVDNLVHSGATSVSLVAFEDRHFVTQGCEGTQDIVEDTGGNYTEGNIGDCVEGGGIIGNSVADGRSNSNDPNDLGNVVETITPEMISVYPQPFTSLVNFDINLNTNSDIKIEVFNNVGAQVINQIDKNRAKGKNTVSIQTDLPQGTYFYKVTFENQTQTGKILKF